jgi:hypothetical protein
MGIIKKVSLTILVILIVILGLVAVQNIIGNNNYSQSSSLTSQSADSVVYIQNGVTGQVTITDPFLNRTTNINIIYYPLDTGSGFIVNSNGYIITALHVVGDLDSLNNQTLKTMDNSDVQRYIERAAVKGYVSEYNPDLSYELANNVSGNSHLHLDLNTTTAILNQKNLLKVQSAQQLIKVNLPGTSSTSLNASIVDVGNPSTDDDVALLKIETSLKNLPKLSVNSKNPGIFEGVHIYGYPGLDNAVNSNYNPSLVTPSSSSGLITSETFKNGSNSNTFDFSTIYENIEDWYNVILTPKTSPNNTLYYGTTAVTTSGYSGGPVVDSKNNVLGIIIFSIGSEDVFKQDLRITSSLFLSSQNIIKICKKNNIPIKVV